MVLSFVIIVICQASKRLRGGRKCSSQSVEMFVRRGISHMRLTSHERNELINEGIDITPLTRITKLEKNILYKITILIL